MENYQLSLLIEQVIEELNKKNSMMKLAVLFTGKECPDYLAIFAQLQKIPANYRLVVCCSESAKNSFEKYKKIIIENLPNVEFSSDLNDCTALILPELSLNSLAKISLGLADNIASQWVQEYLLSRKQVIVTLDYMACLTSGYQNLGEYYRKALLGLNVIVSAITQLARHFQTNLDRRLDKTIIQFADVRYLVKEQVLSIPNASLITPSAKDWLSKQHIKIIRY
ncbi:flavoprotein [Lonepinella koalarum]|uniref:Flavoprotein n=1 Tax=Lonepinella koalarum TaxID=53417 RepID=A0A4R1KPL0_9PAST|nr:flavoprotein [Lonepinella koalarum]MDH2926651.1 hypothetical protein [Lonepinella koalarum]TCK66975.1 flavoprotein [Lonepinella koalarum]